jgi:diacylglycerol O-acyltransferase / wax synthase
VSGAELTVNLLDLEPEPAEVPPPEQPWRPDRVPSDVEKVAWAVNSLVRQPVRLVKATRRTTAMALNLRRRNRQPSVTPPPAPFSAPRTSLNVAITPHRRYAFESVPIDDVKAVKNAFGTTVNDVVLALCAGAMRRYLDSNDEHPEGPLVAMVPVSVRDEDQKGSMGNKVSAMLTTLATDVDDPVERLQTIAAMTRQAKDQEKAIGADTLTDWVEFAAPALAARAARLYSNTKIANRMRPIFNLVVSNVPGPPFPLYSAGAKMVGLYPMGPIADGAGLNITVMSYMDQMNFGLVACREVVEDIWGLTHGIGDALEELKKAAEQAR